VSIAPAADPAVGDRYPRLLRTPSWRWWRPLVGLIFAAAIVVVASIGVILAALAVRAATGGSVDLGGGSGNGSGDDALDPGTPLGLLANNLVLATIIPACVLAVLVVHREPVGFLASVVRRVRWRVLLLLTPLALVLVAVGLGLSLLVPGNDSGTVTHTPSAGTLMGLLAVILVTTPLQCAGEEVGFRGYLNQAVSSWFARPAVGIAVGGAVSAVCFALAHGLQDVPLFADRLSFGAVAAWLVWRTGGLEASIALHVANNLISLVLAAVTGALSDTLSASTLGWPFALLDVAMMVAYAKVAHVLAGRWQLRTVRVLSAPAAIGYPGARPSTPPPAGGVDPWGMG
jgi:membrane protease YdiL (CAAX protease family)